MVFERQILNNYFHPLVMPKSIHIPASLPSPFVAKLNDINAIAVQSLQESIIKSMDWNHNFGLNPDNPLPPIPKMFGVLVVQEMSSNQLGYLAAFSGKIANSNNHKGFVPPIFDSLDENSFLNKGMRFLSQLNEELKTLDSKIHRDKIAELKIQRKAKSHELQQQLFDSYHFLNYNGKKESLRSIFDAYNRKPPSGAGECAAPKLFQFAFQHNLKPISLAEFWWGKSEKYKNWKHKQLYPACKEKCEPILKHMLSGLPT